MINRELQPPENASIFLLGPRQTGKSTWIREHFREKTWYIDLLRSENHLRYARDPAQLRLEAEYRIRQEGIETICIDEVQRIPELLNEVHSLMSDTSCRFILSGSSARKLRRGGTNLLAGRALVRYLFPLNWKELSGSRSLEQLLRFGSLPTTIDKSDEENADFLRAYSDTYLREEIQAEGLARNIGGFARFLDVAAQLSGEIINYSATAREAGLPIRTVQGYYDILVDTLVGTRLEAWRTSARKRLSAHAKFYLFDVGVTNALNRNLNSAPDDRLMGRLFEQFLVLETERRLSYERTDARMFYWRTNYGAEVDLILELRDKPLAAIEMKWTRKPGSTHLSGLRSFIQEHPGTPAYLVCRTERPFLLDGVTVLPWADYLRELESWLH